MSTGSDAQPLLELNVKGLYVIGTLGYVPAPFTIKNDLLNTPDENDGFWGGPIRWWPFKAEQWYWAN